MTNGRLNIGLFICDIDNEFSNSISKGAIFAANEIDANLIIFPGKHINAVYDESIRTGHEYQFNTLFSYASNKNLDVLLVSIGTLGCFLTDEQKKEFLDGFKDIPIITLASEVEGYNFVKFDNYSGLKKLIEHLIKDHNKKKIGFVAGPSTNQDAAERLSTYKKTLIENGIQVDENLIGYGDFSEFTNEVVSELLDNNKDIEAICFANDKMAIGGYQELERRGIKIGSDILVTGFDDSPFAVDLKPTLTTVHADACELGYVAVYQSFNLVRRGEMEMTRVPSSFIIRNSCSCKTFNINDTDSFASIDFMSCYSSSETAYAINERLFTKYHFSSNVKKCIDAMGNFTLKLLNQAKNHSISCFNINELNDIFLKALDTNLLYFVSIDNFYNILDILYFKAKNEISDISKLEGLNAIFTLIYKQLVLNTLVNSKSYNDDVRYSTWLSNSIMQSMLVHKDNEEDFYKSVEHTLIRLNIKSSYIYLFNNPIIHNNGDVWEKPKSLQLKAYNDGNSSRVFVDDSQEISNADIFNNEFTIKDRRYTAVLSPIFSDEEHYGLFLCELDYEYFHYIFNITMQLSSSIKLTRLLNDQKKIQKQLQESYELIKTNNILLNKISKCDELTGAYNRRGFFELSQEIINDIENVDKKAILIFADMDNLKTINDKFGHDEGDYAIKAMAKILKDSFRRGDIVARIGGDEFCACALVNQENSIRKFKRRLKVFTQNLNDISGKPYYISFSVGILEFTCNKTIVLEELLDKADTLLYVEKKKKRKSIVKEII